MELEAICVLRAVSAQEGVDAEKKAFKWFQVCLQADSGLSIFTLAQAPEQVVGANVVAKFKQTTFEGKTKLKLVGIEDLPIR